MENKIAALITEADVRIKIVPAAEPIYDRLFEALEKARLVAQEWDHEMKRAGLNV